MKLLSLTLVSCVLLLGLFTFQGQAHDNVICISVTVTPIPIGASPTLIPTTTLIPTLTPRPSLSPTATTVKLITLTPSPTPVKTITPTPDVRDHPILQTSTAIAASIKATETRLAIALETEQAKGSNWPLITPTEEFGQLPTFVPATIYKVTYQTGMNLRADHKVSSADVGDLYPGQEIGITKEVSDGGYVWGYGQHGGQWVWVALRLVSTGFKYLEEVKQ